MHLEELLIQYHHDHGKDVLVEKFQDDLDPSVTFYVIDKVCHLLPQYDNRRLVFRSGSTYAYSTIYLSKQKRLQPIYESVQRMVECFFPNFNQMERALVLGCAGCSVPRFLALSNPECRITGVEYSEKMVEIARMYFINDSIFNNFHLIREDGFSFVHQRAEKYHFLYADIFQAEKNHPKLLSDDFVNDIASITEEESISIFNLLNLSREESNRFALRFGPLFDAAYLFDETFHYYVAFVKTKHPSGLKDFEARAGRHIRILERYLFTISRTMA